MTAASLHAWLSLLMILGILTFGATGFDAYGHTGSAGMAVCSAPGFLLLTWGGFRCAGSAVCARRRSLFCGLALVLALMAAYGLNPSHRWTSGVGLLPVPRVHWLPAAAFPDGAWASLSFCAAALAVLALAMFLGRRQIVVLTAVVLAGAAVVAILALEQRFRPLGLSAFQAAGLFASGNHVAAFANLLLPVALFAGARLQYRAFLAGRLSNPSGCLYLIAALLMTATVSSRSRAGLAVMALMVSGFVLRQLRLRHRYPFLCAPVSPTERLWLGLGIAAVAGAGVMGFARGGLHLGSIGRDLSFRGQVVADTLSIWRAHPWWGTGPGSFAAVFPYYQSLDVDRYFFAHAHCEAVEFMAEYGLAGGGVVLAGLALVLFSGAGRRSPDARVPTFREVEGAGWMLALAGVGLHSLVDFPFRQPLIALLAFTGAGILAGGAERSSGATVRAPRGFGQARQAAA